MALIDEFDFERLHVDVEGNSALMFMLADSAGRRAWLKDFVLSAGRHAMVHTFIHAPIGDSGYIHEHIGMSGISWRPGGAGGGGTYVVHSGVRAGSSKHPLYVHQGTANLSDAELDHAAFHSPRSTQGRIYPRGDRHPASVVATRRSRIQTQRAKRFHPPVLTFQKRGEPRRFRPSVRGQRPQPFVYFAFASTAVYAEGRVRTAASLFKR